MSYSENETLSRYLSLCNERPELVRNSPGGIEIVTDLEDIVSAREEAMVVRQLKGQNIEDLRTGLLAHDPYMTMVRDAVRFPDGSMGLYNRIIERHSVAVLPLLADQIVLIRIFRHGLRDWLLEFPRGAVESMENCDRAARRELREEIGAETRELIPLGTFTPGASSMSIISELYAARIDAVGQLDRGEGIDRVQLLPVAEFETLIDRGEIIDGFTLSLFARARVRGLI